MADGVDITFPVRVQRTNVYDTIVDAEDRLICFITISVDTDSRSKFIADAINAAKPTGGANG